MVFLQCRRARSARLAANERVAGFIYIGTAKEQQTDRDRPELGKIVSRWTG